MRQVFDSLKAEEQEYFLSALRTFHELRIFQRLDEHLILELAGRTLSTVDDTSLADVCREIRHRRVYIQFLATETADLVVGPDDKLGDVS